MNPADRSPECEFVEVRAAIDISVETDGGFVMLSMSPDDGTEDIAVALTPRQARDLSEHLFTMSYDAG